MCIRDSIKCEPQVGGGILTACIDGELCRIARFSMHHVSRIAHIAGGVQRLQMGLPGLVESRERDNICPRCGRALPGTRKCPHCDGSGGWFAQMVDILKPYSRRLLLISIAMVVAAALKIWIPALQQGFVDGILQPRTAAVSYTHLNTAGYFADPRSAAHCAGKRAGSDQYRSSGQAAGVQDSGLWQVPF